LIHNKETISSIYTSLEISDIDMYLKQLWRPLEEALKSISSPTFNLPELRFRDTQGETRMFQGGPGRGAALEAPGFSPGVSKME
jgi:hypothetical protein